VLSCAKHFPGHGDTVTDSHLALPRVDRPIEGLERVEIFPFRALAKRLSVDAMMTAHVVYPALDAERPATLSRAICTDLLRRDLGFGGVLFSDDLEMKAITGPAGEAAVLAVIAGCDVLLVCSRADLADEVHEALVRECEKSASFRMRCEEARARALAMRRRARPAPVADADVARVFEASADVAAELAQRLAGGTA
jgi:beta-N-acetylhexosaminidase